MSKSALLLFAVTSTGFGQVVVRESTNSVSGERSVTMGVSGDQSFGKLGKLPSLAIVCTQVESHRRVSLVLATGVVVVSYGSSSSTRDSGNYIATRIRLDGDTKTKPQILVWATDADSHSTLVKSGAKFLQDHIFKSAKLHVEIQVFGSGLRVSSFNLAGLQEEYNKHEECKQ